MSVDRRHAATGQTELVGGAAAAVGIGRIARGLARRAARSVGQGGAAVHARSARAARLGLVTDAVFARITGIHAAVGTRASVAVGVGIVGGDAAGPDVVDGALTVQKDSVGRAVDEDLAAGEAVAAGRRQRAAEVDAGVGLLARAVVRVGVLKV